MDKINQVFWWTKRLRGGKLDLFFSRDRTLRLHFAFAFSPPRVPARQGEVFNASGATLAFGFLKTRLP